MRTGLTVLSATTAVLLSSCVPMPSYSVDPYTGSLEQCLDIQGTYENENYYRNYTNVRVGLAGVFPLAFSRDLQKEKGNDLYSTRSSEGQRITKKSWVHFHFVDSQHLEITVFNTEGLSFKGAVDMNVKGNFEWYVKDEFSCNKTSWQHAYSISRSSDGHSTKERRFNRVSRLPNGMLRMEALFDAGGGTLGLYSIDKATNFGYFRKVDLTVDDILAMNDKAKKAIEQYDQVATTPPPQ